MPDKQDILAHHRPRWLRLSGLVLLGLALAVAAIGLTVRLVDSRDTRQWTDQQAVTPVQLISLKSASGGDFTLPGDIQAFTSATIDAQVSGTIQKWFADIGAKVNQGQLLAQIDPRPYEAALASARGQLAKDAATLANARLDLSRYQSLAAQNAISAQQLATQQSTVTADAGVVDTDRAAVQVAEINLGYTRIVAPTDGVIGTRQVLPGQFIAAGTQVTSLAALPLVWVIANYKETQLTHVVVGDAATVTVDTFPGVVFHGHVIAISPASGSEFALLPPDNATGNFTKIVQRVAVKISIDDPGNLAGRLLPGMSVIPTIDTVLPGGSRP